MSDKNKGNLLVAVQFLLLAGLIFTPTMLVWPIQAAMDVVGVALLIPAGLLLVFAFRDLGGSLTANPVPKEDNRLVTTGVYKRIRHPIYTAILILGVAQVLFAGVLPHVIFLIGLYFLFSYKAKWEEQLLAAQHPEYADYLKRTQRFFPRFWR